jgi:deazaflavin-dependent oxidoreductase (nitroreductase family)
VLATGASAVYREFLFWLGRRPAFNWFGPRVFAPIDTWLYPRVHGALVSAGPPVLPLLMLTTCGRQSGRARAVPLLYMRHRESLLVVGSNWGRANHPAWSSNLLANPTARVQVGQASYAVSARLIAPPESTRLWPELYRFCPVWQSYAERSGRDLRVFALTSQPGVPSSQSATSPCSGPEATPPPKVTPLPQA